MDQQPRRQTSRNQTIRAVIRKKEFKKTRLVMKYCGITSRAQTFTLQGSQKKKQGTEILFKEIRAENFPDLGKETDIQVQETEFQTR